MTSLANGPWAIGGVCDAGGNDLDIQGEFGSTNWSFIRGILVEVKAATTAATVITFDFGGLGGDGNFTMRVGGGAGQVQPYDVWVDMGDMIATSLDPSASITATATKPAAGGFQVTIFGRTTNQSPLTFFEPLTTVQGTGTNKAVPTEGTTGTPVPAVVIGKSGGEAVPVSGAVTATVSGAVTIDDSPPIVVVPG